MPRLYPTSSAHVETVRASGGRVAFGIDATRLNSYEAVADAAPYDLIVWNFPHIRGKQNVRKNRALLTAFLASATPLLREATGGGGGGGGDGSGGGGGSGSGSGRIEVALVEGQGGTGAWGERGTGKDAGHRTDESWARSWMASVCGADAGLMLCDVVPFNDTALYDQLGGRGRGRRFDARAAPLVHVYTRPGEGVVGVYQHAYHTELHLMVPLDWSPEVDDARLESWIYSELGGRDGSVLRFRWSEEFVFPDGERRARSFGCTFHSDAIPVSRAEAERVWAAVTRAAAAFDGGAVAIRTKSTCAVSRALPPWHGHLEGGEGESGGGSGGPRPGALPAG